MTTKFSLPIINYNFLNLGSLKAFRFLTARKSTSWIFAKNYEVWKTKKLTRVTYSSKPSQDPCSLHTRRTNVFHEGVISTRFRKSLIGLRDDLRNEDLFSKIQVKKNTKANARGVQPRPKPASPWHKYSGAPFRREGGALSVVERAELENAWKREEKGNGRNTHNRTVAMCDPERANSPSSSRGETLPFVYF